LPIKKTILNKEMRQPHKQMKQFQSILSMIESLLG